MISYLVVGGVVVSIAIGVSLYPAFKVMPFAYGSARVRAARARMFSDDELKSLAGESYKDAIYHLEKRGLTNLLDLIDSDFREELVQKRLSRDYFQHLEKLMKVVPGKYRKFFQALREHSVNDFIVAVIRSKTSPFYDRHILEELSATVERFKTSDVEQIEKLSLDDFLARIKGTKHYELVHAHLDEIKEGMLTSYEAAVSRQHFAELKAIAGNEPTLRKYVQLLIDIYNIRHALCFGERSFIPGGRLLEHTLKDLEASRDLSDIIRSIEKTQFGEFVKDASSIIEVERGLLRAQKAFGSHLLKSQPLSIDPILAYFIHKRIELKNIRILLKLRYARFEPEAIREALV